jgi:photosystem II stability/assembly factor-like uncharacterized protein
MTTSHGAAMRHASSALALLPLAFAACSSAPSLPPSPAPAQHRLPTLTTQVSGTGQLLQAVNAISDKVAWVSGHGGTWARTEDGGATWTTGVVPEADSMQFRDLHAIDAKRVWLLSAGSGPASRIYYSSDGGAHWTQQFRNGNSKAFYDCMDFWDDKQGVALSDGIDGTFALLISRNGKDWGLLPTVASPPARPGEGSFAASGTCVVALEKRFAWFGTGAAAMGPAMVFRTTDAGRTWTGAPTPIASGPSAGIATVAFRDTQHGVALGGNLAKPDEFSANVAVTSDGGVNWEAGTPPPFPGAVYGAAYAGEGGHFALVAVGPKGAAISWDDAQSWVLIDTLSYWSVSLEKDGRGWLVGPKGLIRRLDPAPER